MTEQKLLIIDDEPGHRLMVKAVLEDAAWSIEEASTGQKGLDILGTAFFPVVLLDLRLPDLTGIDVLKQIAENHPLVSVILLTAYGSVDTAVQAMKIGAFDYLTKPVDNEELLAVAAKAHAYSRLLQENRNLRDQIQSSSPPIDLIGASQSMRKVKELIAQVGPTEATVVITGESGTGKELVAEAIHQASGRSKGPLVKVNCAALPKELLESELFGYVKGAFTGASKDKLGRFQLASGGTLFLDEIGDMPLELQPKLLRVLQENEVEPLGSEKTVKTNVRLITATHKDLEQEVQNATFRQDLFFRLNVLEIPLPPLRERKDDIPLLVSFLLKKLGEKNKKIIRDVTPAFLDRLQAYSWPGNVRELENILERAMILTTSATLDDSSLPPQLREGDLPGQKDEGQISLEKAEEKAIIAALDVHKGHREKTADALGISRRALQYKLKKYGLTNR